jgi:hypothetical protein
MPLFGSLIASTNFLLADRSDAAICFTSNHGCLFNARTNSWPTAPVTPMMATRFMMKIVLYTINILLEAQAKHN